MQGKRSITLEEGARAIEAMDHGSPLGITVVKNFHKILQVGFDLRIGLGRYIFDGSLWFCHVCAKAQFSRDINR